MKICLKNPKTKLLVKTPEAATSNPEEALGFSDTDEAVRYSLRNRLWKFRVVLYFNDGSQFVRSVAPNRWEAGVILWMERLVSAAKRHFHTMLPTSRPKPNPFALRIS